MSNAAQRLGPPSGAGWTCQQCGTRNAVNASICSKCGALSAIPSLDTKTRGPVVEGDSVTLAPQSDAIDLRNGQRRWEGEHRVVIVSRDLPMNAELLIDGKGIQNAKRIEIDVDCDKETPIVKITQIAIDERPDAVSFARELTHELTANLLNITLDEARVVDVILNKARQEASSNGMAVQLFAITDTDEHGEQTTQVLGDVLRDAARYRALSDAVGDERIWVYENGFRESEYIVGSLGLEALSEKLVAHQAAELRAQKERAQ